MDHDDGCYMMIEKFAKAAFPQIYFENLEKYDGKIWKKREKNEFS